ncbi:MAG: hypothetical protein Q8O19_07310 [Rectinemataceae bacterium]|nr:hypothetical protein [Rectinemataceae bacterium]
MSKDTFSSYRISLHGRDCFGDVPSEPYSAWKHMQYNKNSQVTALSNGV